MGERIGSMSDVHALKDVRHLLANLAAGLADRSHRVAHVLPDSLARQESEVLRDDSHLAAKNRNVSIAEFVERLAPKAHGPARVPHLPCEKLQYGRLARAGRTDEEYELPLRDRQRQAAQPVNEFAVSYFDIVEQDVGSVRVHAIAWPTHPVSLPILPPRLARSSPSKPRFRKIARAADARTWNQLNERGEIPRVS